MNWKDMKLGIKLTNKGTVNKPSVEIRVYGLNSFDYDELIDELDYRFEWSTDDSEFYKKVKDDDLLAPVLEKFKGMKGFCGEDLYDYSMIATFPQNTTAKRTAQMTKVMLEKYGTLLEFDKKKFWCFWTPKDLIKVPEQELGDLKVMYSMAVYQDRKEFLRDIKRLAEEGKPLHILMNFYKAS